MIFLAVGTQKFQFNRLVREIDRLVGSGEITDRVIGQIGYCDYEPENYEYKKFMDSDEFASNVENADVIITHGGAGTVIDAIKKRKKVVAVPRVAGFGEHVNDHQMQLVRKFSEMNLIAGAADCSEIGEILKTIENRTFDVYEPQTEYVMESIEEYIIQCCLVAAKNLERR